MEFATDRRKFLQLAGTGAVVSLAGCSSLQSDDVQAETTTTSEMSEGETSTVTVSLEIDEEALKELEADLRAQLQNETINQTEAQRQYQIAQTELITDAIEQFRERTEGKDSIAIENEAEQLGLLLVSGTPASLIESLGEAEVRGLLPEEVFAEAQAQSGGS